jgi:AraC-like DNA-binding protein
MAQVVPLIRAAALMPALRWLRENGRSVGEVLAQSGHGYLASADPFTPVPLLAAADVMAVLERREGPDIGLRMVTQVSLLELAVVSRGVLGARTPREAFARVVMAMPHHCTHEMLSLAATEDGILVRDKMAVPMAPATRHVVDQYILGIIREVCALTGAPGLLLHQVEMTPHPERGFAHLAPWFGDKVAAARGHSLSARIVTDVADRPFRKVARHRFAAPASVAGATLRGDGSLAQSIRHLLPLLLEDGSPSLDRLARLSGMSRRTLQRRLSDEATSFSDLFSEIRQLEALRRLSGGDEPIAEVSRQLGFSQQSALTRAMRRWTGEVPSKVRARTVP